MEYSEKLEVCYREMADEFGITEKQAKSIITWLDLEELVIDRYAEEIKWEEKKQG